MGILLLFLIAIKFKQSKEGNINGNAKQKTAGLG